MPNHFLDEEGIDLDSAEYVASDIFSCHGHLLSKGLALNSFPTVQQALDGILPNRLVSLLKYRHIFISSNFMVFFIIVLFSTEHLGITFYF